MRKTIEVAVGLIFNAHHEVLLAWRAAHQTPGNCWEFPGGKVEKGETGYQALVRELFEEVGVRVESAVPWPSISHCYETLTVVLHPWCVEKYAGVPCGMEGQMIAWFPLSQLTTVQLPAANASIVNGLLEKQQSCASPL